MVLDLNSRWSVRMEFNFAWTKWSETESVESQGESDISAAIGQFCQVSTYQNIARIAKLPYLKSEL